MLRFAPSPTGNLHIGNLRVALINHIISVQNKEDLILRIDDTDNERNDSQMIENIVRILQSFGISFSKMFSQSENLKFHQSIAMDLLTKRKAFCCFCSQEEIQAKKDKAKKDKKPYRYDNTCLSITDKDVLEAEGKPFTIRLRSPENNISFIDKVKGEISLAPFEVDSTILLRSDKKPTYNFASSVDDMLNDISLVIRGDDHLTNTPKQLHILNSINYDKEINFAHLPIILNTDGKKMSKREESSSVQWLISKGYLETAIANYLLLLGNQTPKEVFTLDEACEWFDLSKLSSSSAKFDINKLNFLNREHILISDDIFISEKLGYSDINIGKLIKLYTEEASTLEEIKSKITKTINKKETPNEWKENYNIIKKLLINREFEKDFNDFKNNISKESNLKGKNLLKPLRYILTGEFNGPNLSEIYPLIYNYLLKVTA